MTIGHLLESRLTNLSFMHRLKLVRGKAARGADTIRDAWKWLTPTPKREQLSDGEWAACTLAGKAAIPGTGCTRYAFRLNSARQVGVWVGVCS